MAYYDDEIVQAVWDKGRGMPDKDPGEWRQDNCGAWLQRDQYNKSDSEYGWKILNIVAGGSEDIENLQPYHWRNTYDIENGHAQCSISADRTKLTPGQYIDQPHNNSG